MENVRRKYSLEEYGVQKHKKILDNGLKVTFIEKPFAPIYAKLMMRAGSIFNPSDNGLAHFTEHMIVGASEKYPRKDLMAQIINTVGGYSNASTGERSMSVTCEVGMLEHMVHMKEHFTNAMEDLYITPALFEKEMSVITSEINRATSEPYYHAKSYINSIITNQTEWSHSNLGTVDSIHSLNPEMVHDFFERNCTVENMALVVCGGCTLSDLEKTFGDIAFKHGDKINLLPLDPPPLVPNQRIFYRQDLDETNVGLLFQGPKAGTRESYLLSFAMGFAHAGLDSKFYQKIRNERGLAYSLSKNSRVFDNLKYISTNLGVSPSNLDAAIGATIECYDELLQDGMNESQIKNRIDRLYFSNKRELERSVDWIGKFDDELYDEDFTLFGDYPDVYNFYETITSEEIKDVLQKYITLDSFHLVVVGKESGTKYF